MVAIVHIINADVHWTGGVVQEGDVQEGGSCAGLRREVRDQYMYCKICTVLTLDYQYVIYVCIFIVY